MKALRFLRALPLVVLLAGAPLHAEQGTIVGPTVGPKTMTEVMTTLNAALLAIQSCNSGTSAPANGPGAAPKAFQCWADTSASPVITYKTYDGASWVALGKLNASTHIWTPVYQGTDSGTASTATTGTSGHTLGFLDGANTWSAIQSFNSATLSLKGSTSGAGTLTAPAVASSYIWTLPAQTDTLVGKATVDTLTNKTFDTAATGNSLSINGLAATANTGTGAVARATSPTFVTPTLGAASATSINGNVWTASTGTLTLGAGKTATISNTLTFAGTDGSTVALGAGGTVAYLANTLNVFAATTSAQLATVISDETGSGALVFGTSPTLVTPTLGVASATSINKVALTAPATGATLTIPDGVTLTGPAASGTAMTLGNAETVAGAKSFNDATLILKGSTSGAGTLKAPAAAASYIWTMFAATDTVVGKATTDTFTNKTFDTAGAGNSLAINGLAATANTGTGAVVRAVSPAITTPTGIVKGDVGLSNVDNTSDATKNAAAVTLTNKTLTAPVINAPTGIVKADVGLGNVDNTSDVTKWAAAKTLTNTTFDTAGTGNSFSINGIAATANTGTGSIVRATSPALAGVPTAPTASPSNNSTQLATTAYVDAQVAGGVAGVTSVNGQAGILKMTTAPQGRLTLQSGTPVMTTAQSAKTTIYYSAYTGDQIPIYDGTNMAPTTITGGEISVATTDTTKSPAAIGASKVNDWFVWVDSGTLRIGHGPDWTSDTARSAGTALVKVNGIWLNSVGITNGPAASRGTYVGTTRSNASSQLDFIPGGAGGGGVAAIFGLWNAYNRVAGAAWVQDTGSSSNVSSTIRALNNSANNRISLVRGLDEDVVSARFQVRVATSTFTFIHIGLDSTTVPAPTFMVNGVVNQVGADASLVASYEGVPGLGYRSLYALEQGSGSGTATLTGGASEALTARLLF